MKCEAVEETDKGLGLIDGWDDKLHPCAVSKSIDCSLLPQSLLFWRNHYAALPISSSIRHFSDQAGFEVVVYNTVPLLDFVNR